MFFLTWYICLIISLLTKLERVKLYDHFRYRGNIMGRLGRNLNDEMIKSAVF